MISLRISLIDSSVLEDNEVALEEEEIDGPEYKAAEVGTDTIDPLEIKALVVDGLELPPLENEVPPDESPMETVLMSATLVIVATPLATLETMTTALDEAPMWEEAEITAALVDEATMSDEAPLVDRPEYKAAGVGMGTVEPPEDKAPLAEDELMSAAAEDEGVDVAVEVSTEFPPSYKNELDAFEVAVVVVVVVVVEVAATVEVVVVVVEATVEVEVEVSFSFSFSMCLRVHLLSNYK